MIVHAFGAGLLAVGVLGGMVGPAPGATGGLTRGQFHTQLMAAIDSAKVFEPGTTLTLSGASNLYGEDVSGGSTVNQDGSLTMTRTDRDMTWDVRCASMDVCWQRVTNELADPTWYPMPAGAVGYDVASTFYSLPHRDYWRAGSVFSVRKTSDGATVFLAVASQGPEGSRLRTIDRFVVRDRRLTWSIRMSLPGKPGTLPYTVTYASAVEPTQIASPPADQIGIVPSQDGIDPDDYADASGNVDWSAVPGGIAWFLPDSLVVQRNAPASP